MSVWSWEPGLGALAREIEAEATIPYPEIPFFPKSTVESHKGQLVCGQLAGQSVIAMEGRFHLYEGYSPWQVTFPIRVMKELGCQLLVVSNAAGGLNPLCSKGDLIVIEDHINLMGQNPLIGPNDDRLGPRFPDLIEPYDRELQNLALKVALEQNIVAHRGVYVAVVGPNLETRAEYRFLRHDRRGRGGHVDDPRSLGRGTLWHESRRFLDHHGYVSARRTSAGAHRGDHRRGQRGRGQAADRGPWSSRAVERLILVLKLRRHSGYRSRAGTLAELELHGGPPVALTLDPS